MPASALDHRVRCPALSKPLALVRWAALAALTACGDGSDVPAPMPASLAISGTAATGAAIADAPVQARCASGNGSATTAADGSYTLQVEGGTLPCAMRVTPAGGSPLHAVALGNGNSATANLTPATELVVARLAGSMPAAYFDAFGAAPAAALTPDAAQAAVASVEQTLQEGGVDFSAAGDLLTGPIVAAGGGNAHDQALGALSSRLAASGSTLAQVAAAVAAGSPAATTRSTVASLPAALLLAPAAPNCASLRSGKYRVVIAENNDDAGNDELLTIDAPNLSVTESSGPGGRLVPTGVCTFKDDDGGEYVVTKAGVAIGRARGSDGRLHGLIIFPEQKHTVAELADTWDAIGLDGTEGDGPIGTTFTGTFDRNGKLTAGVQCDDAVHCVTVSPLPDLAITANAVGGFDLTNTTDGWSERLFFYRAGGGWPMLVLGSGGGHFQLATPNFGRPLPTVGRTTLNWGLSIFANTTANALAQGQNTVTSVDKANGSFTRDAVVSFSPLVTVPETLTINDPRPGYTRRPPATVTASDGSTRTRSEFVALTMTGMDLSAVLPLPADNTVFLSATVSTTDP